LDFVARTGRRAAIATNLLGLETAFAVAALLRLTSRAWQDYVSRVARDMRL